MYTLREILVTTAAMPGLAGISRRQLIKLLKMNSEIFLINYETAQ